VSQEAVAERFTFVAPTNSTTQQVYAWLHDRIIAASYRRGTRLSETEIAGQIGLSRQPVREAFIRLTADGLTEVRPQRGTFIAASPSRRCCPRG
jgi:DNA-binding GntR family transcriptional regulator